jgi:hypothetical protein
MGSDAGTAKPLHFHFPTTDQWFSLCHLGDMDIEAGLG